MLCSSGGSSKSEVSAKLSAAAAGGRIALGNRVVLITFRVVLV